MQKGHSQYFVVKSVFLYFSLPFTVKLATELVKFLLTSYHTRFENSAAYGDGNSFLSRIVASHGLSCVFRCKLAFCACGLPFKLIFKCFCGFWNSFKRPTIKRVYRQKIKH